MRNFSKINLTLYGKIHLFNKKGKLFQFTSRNNFTNKIIPQIRSIMKKIVYLSTVLALSLLGFTSCSSTNNVAQAPVSNTEIANLISSENFTFVATKAYPTDQTTINVMNNLRPAGSAFRMLDISYGYGFKLDGITMKADMPFFGRIYNPSYNPDDNGIKFDSKSVRVVKTDGKKKTTFTIRPTDISKIDTMYLEVYPNGKSFLSINSNDRQPISYDGYIKPNKADQQ